MDFLLTLWPLLLCVSLATCKVWSFDFYPKKLPCNMVYILTQNSIKHPCSTRYLGPCVLLSLSLSLSLSLYFQLIPWSVKAGCLTQEILASFLLSLSYHWLWTTRFWLIKGPQQQSTWKRIQNNDSKYNKIQGKKIEQRSRRYKMFNKELEGL